MTDFSKFNDKRIMLFEEGTKGISKTGEKRRRV